MNILSLNEEFTPLSFGILNEKGELVFGDEPCKKYEGIVEYEYILNKKHYKLVATFGKGTERQQAAFAISLAAAKTMISPVLPTKTHNFYHVYSTLLELLKREVSSGIAFPCADGKRDCAPVSVSQRGFFTCVLLLCVFIKNCGATVDLGYEQRLGDFLITVSTQDLKKTLPLFVTDYCVELASTNGFGLLFERRNESFCAVLQLRKDILRDIELNSEPWSDSEFDEISRAVDLFSALMKE